MGDTDSSSIERLIDANLNRVAEALRVAEDVCRFHWNLPGFASDLKSLRHDALAAVDRGSRARIQARDIAGDVGKETPSPSAPSLDLPSVAFRNLQRAKEALRAIEEASRPRSAAAARDVQALRYRLYAVEKGIARLARVEDAGGRVADCRVMLLVGAEAGTRRTESVVEESIRAGVDAIQLREKAAPDREVLRLARSLREITARTGTLLLINDRPDLAALCLADGVHLGQDDLPIAEARSIVGRRRLVGVSTHSTEQARQAERDGADYIGVGPMFPSRTKDAGPLLGPEGLGAVLREVTVPAFAIGGITGTNVEAIRARGATRVAVSSAVLDAPDLPAAVRALRAALGA